MWKAVQVTYSKKADCKTIICVASLQACIHHLPGCKYIEWSQVIYNQCAPGICLQLLSLFSLWQSSLMTAFPTCNVWKGLCDLHAYAHKESSVQAARFNFSANVHGKRREGKKGGKSILKSIKELTK